MDLDDTQTLVTLLSGLAILIGLIGVLVPILPGLLLCWAGVLGWAIFSDAGGGRWLVVAVATLIAVGGTVTKYLWPGRDLKRAGVPNRSLLVGGALGLVGFFVVPVLGLVVGFVLGVWLAERQRLGDFAAAWPATKRAVLAVGLAMLIELGAAFAIAGLWLLGLLAA
ncbi:DUF456 domain-containing protein [Solwaraspora sp. WMMA2080]|uniref:DUF456 domain-containing protein n=1 Tax=unclassified Solwaraspora TaxID=2627926 RepID=UPI00248B8D7D|nr:MULTISPECIES: DUF456 domain-containing protein [unclassified Solwaraspora]WBB95862.1 DUF456 domain-containing protein [Solwaraspora sp. WMMA2059]WBC20234.1 DUF456 domain-containing protein [Solwaraspora sp. WMMA2080]